MTADSLFASSAPVSSGSRDDVQESAAGRWLPLVFTYLIIGAYTEVPLYVSDTFGIPAFAVLLVLPPLLLALRHRILEWDRAFYVQFFLLLVASVFLSPGGGGFLKQKLLGLVQTSVAVLCGIALLEIMRSMPHEQLRRILFVLWLSIVIGVVLEVTGLLRPLSDAFASAVYVHGGYQAYDAAARDVSITGFPRPKLFTSEPSLVAIGFYVLLTAWLFLRPTMRSAIGALASSVVMFAFVGSPIMLIAFTTSILIVALSGKRPKIGVLIFSGAVGVGALWLLAALAPSVVANIQGRWEETLANALTLGESSENIRLVFPYFIATDVLRASPWMGVGLTGKGLIPSYMTLPIPEDIPVSNNVANLLIYFGIIGTLALCLILRRYWKKIGVRSPVLLAMAIGGLMMSMGGFETPRFWMYVFLLTGAASHSSTQAEASGA